MTPFEQRIKKAMFDAVDPYDKSLYGEKLANIEAKAAAQVAIEEIASAYQDGWLARNNDEPMDTKEYLQSRGIAQAESAAQKCNCEFPKYNGTTCSKCDLPY